MDIHIVHIIVYLCAMSIETDFREDLGRKIRGLDELARSERSSGRERLQTEDNKPETIEPRDKGHVPRVIHDCFCSKIFDTWIVGRGTIT